MRSEEKEVFLLTPHSSLLTGFRTPHSSLDSRAARNCKGKRLTDFVAHENHTMTIALSCNCGRNLRIKDELAGKQIRCPSCKSVLSVPVQSIQAGERVLQAIRSRTMRKRTRRSWK